MPTMRTLILLAAGLCAASPLAAQAKKTLTLDVGLVNASGNSDFTSANVGEKALVAPLSSKIGLRLSYVIRFDNQPEPTFEKTDKILTTGIQVAL